MFASIFGPLRTGALGERSRQSALLAEAVSRLPDAERRVFLMCTRDRRPYEDVAAMMGTSIADVEALLASALLRIVRSMDEEPSDVAVGEVRR